MAFTPAPGEQYTIRQKILKIFGAAFHIYDRDGHVVGYCKQKAFRLRENLVLYTDESRSAELLSIQARTIMDFGTTYDVSMPGAGRLGSVRRKGFKSMVRDEWVVLGPDEEQIALLQEDSAGMALARRFLPLIDVFSPQKFHLTLNDGTHAATFRTHFHPFVYRLGVAIHTNVDGDPGSTDPQSPIDEPMILAVGFLIAAIEGRQSSGGSGSGLFSGD